MPSNEQVVRLLKRGNPEIEAANPVEWLIETGGVIDAIPYHWLYWPSLTEAFGSVVVDFIGDGGKFVRERMSSAISGGSSGRSAEEWVSLVESFNYLEVSQIFRLWGGSIDSGEEVQCALVDLLIPPWQARLQTSYPGRSFLVQLSPPEPDLGVCIEVKQLSPSLRPPEGW